MLVFDKDGKSIDVFPVDARELISTGEYFTHNPVTGEKPESNNNTVIGKYDSEVNVDTMTREELLEYALEKFHVKLNNRWGESRMISEIKRIQESNKREQLVEDDTDE